MSGVLGIAAAIGGAIGGANGGIANMFTTLSPPITVGGVPLTDFAVPREVGIGGEQEIVVSKIPGGQYAIQTLGDFPDPIELSGRFIGPTRDQDAAQFELMRQGGTPVPLIAMGISLNVIVHKFRRTYESGYIAYAMLLFVVPDPPGQQDQSGSSALTDSVASDSSSAQASLGSTGASSLDPTTLQAAGLDNLAATASNTVSQTAAAAQGIANLGSAATGAEVISASGSSFGISGDLSGTPTTISAGLSGTAATIGALGSANTAANNLATVQGSLEGGLDQVNGLFAGGWTGAVPLAAQAAPALRYAIDATGKLAGTIAAAAFVARARANLLNAGPNAGALPSPGAPGLVITPP